MWEQTLKERVTWKGDTSTASISVQIEEEDNITDAQNFFLGPKKVSKVLMKEVLLFEPITDNNYPKVETVDLALTNIIGKMTSNWIINDRVKGSIIVQNLASSKFRLGEDTPLRLPGAWNV